MNDILINLLPEVMRWLVTAMLILLGVVLAKAIQITLSKIVTFSRIDWLLKKMGVDKYLARAEISLDAGKVIGYVAYWFVMLVVIMAASDTLGWMSFSEFLRNLIEWVITRALGAAGILLLTAWIAEYSKKLASTSTKIMDIKSGHYVGIGVWWIVVIFGVQMALTQLGLDTTLLTSSIQSIITGAIFAVSLALGLAFGLGGRSVAEDMLKRFKDHSDK